VGSAGEILCLSRGGREDKLSIKLLERKKKKESRYDMFEPNNSRRTGRLITSSGGESTFSHHAEGRGKKERAQCQQEASTTRTSSRWTEKKEKKKRQCLRKGRKGDAVVTLRLKTPLSSDLSAARGEKKGWKMVK